MKIFTFLFAIFLVGCSTTYEPPPRTKAEIRAEERLTKQIQAEEKREAKRQIKERLNKIKRIAVQP